MRDAGAAVVIEFGQVVNTATEGTLVSGAGISFANGGVAAGGQTPFRPAARPLGLAVRPALAAGLAAAPAVGGAVGTAVSSLSITTAHVAYQHHERQDATGYPRGLRGSNRMIRTSAERLLWPQAT